MTVAPDTDETPCSAVHSTVARRIIWRMLADVAASTPRAVCRAVELVAVEELTNQIPSAGTAYRLMAELAHTGTRPTPEAVMAKAVRDGLLGPDGDALKRVLLALPGASGEALRLAETTADVAGLILRGDAETFSHAMRINASSLPMDELVAAIRAGCAAMLAAVARFERAQRPGALPAAEEAA